MSIGGCTARAVVLALVELMGWHMKKPRRRKPRDLVRVTDLGGGVFGVYAEYVICAEKKTLRGKTKGRNAKEVERKTRAWIRKEREEKMRERRLAFAKNVGMRL